MTGRDVLGPIVHKQSIPYTKRTRIHCTYSTVVHLSDASMRSAHSQTENQLFGTEAPNSVLDEMLAIT